MQQCQICFKVAEEMFIAPALLPSQTKMASAIEQVWRGASPDIVVHLNYPFLHEAVLRGILCGIGVEAGIYGVYWAYGVCFYDSRHKSSVRIYSELHAHESADPSGRVILEVAGQSASELAIHIVNSIQELNVGRPPEVIWEAGQPSKDAPSYTTKSFKEEAMFREIRPAGPRRSRAEPQQVYVSYAWTGESEAIVDQLERKLARHVKLVRDRNVIRPGDWISRFMADIGRADCVLVILSEQYLRSLYCMRELLFLFNTSLGERERFMQRIVPLTVGNVRFSRARDRAEHIRYWKHERKKLDVLLADLGHASVGDADRAELLLIIDVQHRLSDMLAWVADVLMPRSAELSSKGVDAAIELLLERDWRP
jgi:internalin A